MNCTLKNLENISLGYRPSSPYYCEKLYCKNDKLREPCMCYGFYKQKQFKKQLLLLLKTIEIYDTNTTCHYNITEFEYKVAKKREKLKIYI